VLIAVDGEIAVLERRLGKLHEVGVTVGHVRGGAVAYALHANEADDLEEAPVAENVAPVDGLHEAISEPDGGQLG
jgi:hypothetical protein